MSLVMATKNVSSSGDSGARYRSREEWRGFLSAFAAMISSFRVQFLPPKALDSKFLLLGASQDVLSARSRQPEIWALRKQGKAPVRQGDASCQKKRALGNKLVYSRYLVVGSNSIQMWMSTDKSGSSEMI